MKTAPFYNKFLKIYQHKINYFFLIYFKTIIKSIKTLDKLPENLEFLNYNDNQIKTLDKLSVNLKNTVITTN